MRPLLVLVWRVGVDALALWLGGGVAAVRHPIAMAFLIAEAIWSLTEGALARAELSASARRQWQQDVDAETLAFVMAGKRWVMMTFIYQAAVLLLFGRGAPVIGEGIPPVSIAGFLIYAGGAVVRGWAIAVMGDRFKSWTVFREPAGLVVSGPYALVRHPSYLGLLMISSAAPLIFNQLWALIVVPILVVLVMQRIRLEEGLLAGAYGDDYVRYGDRARARLIPFVW